MCVFFFWGGGGCKSVVVFKCCVCVGGEGGGGEGCTAFIRVYLNVILFRCIRYYTNRLSQYFGMTCGIARCCGRGYYSAICLIAATILIEIVRTALVLLIFLMKTIIYNDKMPKSAYSLC